MSGRRQEPTRRAGRWIVAGAVVLMMGTLSSCSDRASDDVPVEPAAARSADHHVHLSSPVAAAHVDRITLLVGERSEEDPPSQPQGAEDALAALDSAGIELGLVISNAYMFGMPEAELENPAEAVRAENAFLAEQAAAHPERLIGLCSVNPLAEYATEEVERCGADPGIGGLKLHLANSDVDLRDPSQRATLAALLDQADALGLPLLIHLRTREPDYGEVDVRLFVDSVLVRAETVPIQIAHMAGWGGYDDATDAALGEFVTAIEDGRADGERLTFGLGAVVFDPDIAVAGGDTATARTVREANAKLAERIRALGTSRVVYATDWPSWPPVSDKVTGIARNVEFLRRVLPLEEAELNAVMSNVGPIFRWNRQGQAETGAGEPG